jgi:hypothetical protein
MTTRNRIQERWKYMSDKEAIQSLMHPVFRYCLDEYGTQATYDAMEWCMEVLRKRLKKIEKEKNV